MVKIFIFLIIACVEIFAKPSQVIEPINDSAYKYFDINSTIMQSKSGRVYKIFTALAKDKNNVKNVLFMTDGNAQFSMLLNAFKPSEHQNPPLIIAIGYDTNLAYDKSLRTYDLTPFASGDEYKDGGGADEFYGFIRETLLPFVKKNFEVKNAKYSLYGHSFGGLFTLFSMLKGNEMFDNYFIASPSLWWGESSIIKDVLRDGKISNKLNVKFVRVSVGELEKRKGKTDKPGTINAKQLTQILRDSGVECEFIFYKGQTHGGVIPLGLRDTLKYLSK
ncbi:alpha/beta hydrolase [Campylobacter suis]|uniref:Ferri-bacillibactin esterase BesA n=1 Tax=Campylobacter suis TaxID=2790657 RepID=A0ABN7K5C6_9BACT|nr:alpha/beta hydrolase-fold protein [Campylobacter suis]CAD7287144.1 Ferri-bacillibactin esterase BesA [Campylobacter suis]